MTILDSLGHLDLGMGHWIILDKYYEIPIISTVFLIKTVHWLDVTKTYFIDLQRYLQEIFTGTENSVRMQQTYTHQFQCVYDLWKYPFDTQVCYIQMSVASIL